MKRDDPLMSKGSEIVRVSVLLEKYTPVFLLIYGIFALYQVVTSQWAIA